MKETITVDEVIDGLNYLLQVDPKAISDLIETRVSCSQNLANHPTVQVVGNESEGYRVGLLGILNGLFGVDAEGWGPIAAQFEKDDLGTVVGFTRSDAVRR